MKCFILTKNKKDEEFRKAFEEGSGEEEEEGRLVAVEKDGLF